MPFTLQIGQKQNASIIAHQPLTREDIDAVVAGDKSLYAFGNVYYRDTFGADRVTRFCYKTTELELPRPWLMEKGETQVMNHKWTMAPLHNDST